MPRLRKALKNATGGSNKSSDLSFSLLQMELDEISRDNVLRFKIPPYITIIIRSLTILEGFALDVDPNFRLLRGAYPYVLKQLLAPDGEEKTPKALNELLIRLLTVNGEQKEVEWGKYKRKICWSCSCSLYKRELSFVQAACVISWSSLKRQADHTILQRIMMTKLVCHVKQ